MQVYASSSNPVTLRSSTAPRRAGEENGEGEMKGDTEGLGKFCFIIFKEVDACHVPVRCFASSWSSRQTAKCQYLRGSILG